MTYTFTSGVGAGFDNGIHTFTNGATLFTNGIQTITATDAANPLLTLTGFQNVTVLTAIPAIIKVTNFPSSIAAGTPGSYTVSIFDAYGNLETNYTGTVTITSSDPYPASFSPATYTFTSGAGAGFDNGSHTFTNGATLFTAGAQSITASDSTLAITGSQTGIIVTPVAASSVQVTAFPTPTTAGSAHNYTITVKDSFGNVATGYRGTMTFTSSDPQATFTTSPYTFTAADAGVHTFTSGATLKTAGTQSITATDAANSLSGSETGIVVNPSTASTVLVTGFPSPDPVGTMGTYKVTLDDLYGNVATGYAGTMTFTSSDPQATFAPASYTFTAGDAGIHTFTNGAVLKTVGTQSITATDAANSLSGSQLGIVVVVGSSAIRRQLPDAGHSWHEP